MTDEHALFLKTFNPCSDRVEVIQQSLHDNLDEQAELELSAHIETCRRCKRYKGYLEAVENGFKNLPADLSEISPLASRELPPAVQDEMTHAMKRNLSRWLLETVRAIMYRQKMIVRYFYEDSDLKPLNYSIGRTMSICCSLKKMERLSRNNLSYLPEVELLVKNILNSQLPLPVSELILGLKASIALHKRTQPYDYYHQLYIAQDNLIQAETINHEALNVSCNADERSTIQNNLGVLAHRAGRLNEAAQYYQKSLKEVSVPTSSLNLALVYLDKKRTSDAYSQIAICFDNINGMPNPKLRGKLHRLCTRVLTFHFTDYQEIIYSNSKLKDLTNYLIGNKEND